MAASVWRGYITFGLISIPVRLVRAARAERVTLRQLYRIPASSSALDVEDELAPTPIPGPRPVASGSSHRPDVPEPSEHAEPQVAPVRRAAAAQNRDEVLDASAVTKGYEVEPGRYVTLAADELKAIEPKTATEMELLEFVKLSDIDPVYFETSYYVRPEPAGEKAYAVLWKSLRSTGLVAIGKFAMHRREHVTILRSGVSGLIAHTTPHFASEVRTRDEEYKPDTKLVTNAKELELANTLVTLKPLRVRSSLANIRTRTASNWKS